MGASTGQSNNEKAQRSISIIVGPCTRAHADAVRIDVQEHVDQRWPELGAAVAVEYEVER
jgi:hypothetical protein